MTEPENPASPAKAPVDQGSDKATEAKNPRKSKVDDATKKAWVTKINERLGSQCRGIFDTGDILVEAKGALIDKDFREVVKATGFGSFKNADNYMRVAKHDSLRKPGIFEHLPATVGALIDMAVWNEPMLLKAIDEKVLHPLATRQNLKAWETEFVMRPSARPKAPDESDAVVGYIIADKMTYKYWPRRLKGRLDAYIKRINAAGFDLAFMASTDEKVAHYRILRALLEDKIKRNYAPEDEALFEEHRMKRIFGDFQQFKNEPLNWTRWVPLFVTAHSMGRAPNLNLTPDEIAFIRSQTEPRKPFPNLISEKEARQGRHSVERFMVKTPKAKRNTGKADDAGSSVVSEATSPEGTYA